MSGTAPTLPIPTGADRARRSRAPRMRVLCVLESTNQLYSGIGRNLFETAKQLADRVSWEFAIDDWNPENVRHLLRFCDEHGLPIHVGPGRTVPGQCAPRNEHLPKLLRQRRWDAVDLVGWANSASHAVVIDEIGDTTLFYTPHDQPTWTVDLSPAESDHVVEVHQRVIRRADVVFCDSPWERRTLEALDPGRGQCHYVPLGCDFDAFRPGTLDRRPQLLFVGDLREYRKRFDRVVGVFARLHRARPDIRLVVIGNRSEEIGRGLFPEALRSSCELRGYVSEAELRQAYAESLGLLLLSDFEAFGLPILESLACGTPVFLNRQDVLLSLFGDCPGAHFCPAKDLDVTTDLLWKTLERGPAAIAEALDDRPRLQSRFDWTPLADRKWRAMASCWFYRNHWPWRG